MATDQNGFEIKKGDTVVVDDPKGNDMWNHSFAGQVEEIKADSSPMYDAMVDGLRELDKGF